MNNQIFLTLHSLSHQSAFLDWLIIFSSNLFGVIMIFLAVLFLFFHTDGVFDYKKPFLQLNNKIKEILFVLFSGAFAWLIANIIKSIIFTPRPYLYFENVKPLFMYGGFESFPSGHATFFSALAFSLFLRHRTVGFIYIIVALIVSLSRVISGIHFPVDILAGFVIGITIALIFNLIFKKK